MTAPGRDAGDVHGRIGTVLAPFVWTQGDVNSVLSELLPVVEEIRRAAMAEALEAAAREAEADYDAGRSDVGDAWAMWLRGLARKHVEDNNHEGNGNVS